MLNKDKMTITADLMYLIVLGDDNAMTKITNKLNDQASIPTDKTIKLPVKSTAKPSIKTKRPVYIKHDMSIPCSEILDKEFILNILRTDAIERIKKLKGNDYQPTIQDIEQYMRYVNPGEGVESAQSYAYADIIGTDTFTKVSKPTDKDNMKMLIMIKEVENEKYFELTYPDITLGTEEDAGALVKRWLKSNNLNEMIKQMIVRPVNIVGKDNEILVFTAFVKDIV
jgi:hypothetical protein